VKVEDMTVKQLMLAHIAGEEPTAVMVEAKRRLTEAQKAEKKGKSK
jgi:hypothetical protein